MRRSGVVGVTGEVPANAVPRPTECTHWGDAALSPWLASTVSMSGPARVWPSRSPQEALPVGSPATSAAARVDDHGVGNARDTAATTGRSPSPLLETVRPLVPSDTCTTAGMAYRLIQERGAYSRTPLTTCSDRWSVSFTTPALTPASIRDCAAADDATATKHATLRRGRRMALVQ